MGAEEMVTRQGLRKTRKYIFFVGLVIVIVVLAGLGSWYFLGGYSEVVASTPHCNLIKKGPIGFTFIISSMSSNSTTWSDVGILLSGDNFSRPGLFWNPTKEALWNSSGGMTTETIESPGVVEGGMSISCSVTDILGNGFVGNEDYFTLIIESGSFEAGSSYEVALEYQPTARPIGVCEFEG
ncbi:MAG: hypothetical protein ABIE25_02075 [Thermoplasmatota archaeon]